MSILGFWDCVLLWPVRVRPSPFGHIQVTREEYIDTTAEEGSEKGGRKRDKCKTGAVK